MHETLECININLWRGLFYGFSKFMCLLILLYIIQDRSEYIQAINISIINVAVVLC